MTPFEDYVRYETRRHCYTVPEQHVQYVPYTTCQVVRKDHVRYTTHTKCHYVPEVKTRQIVKDIAPRSVGRFLKTGRPAAPSQPLLAQRRPA